LSTSVLSYVHSLRLRYFTSILKTLEYLNTRRVRKTAKQRDKHRGAGRELHRPAVGGLTRGGEKLRW
jgi:hypothetical protein